MTLNQVFCFRNKTTIQLQALQTGEGRILLPFPLREFLLFDFKHHQIYYVGFSLLSPDDRGIKKRFLFILQLHGDLLLISELMLRCLCENLVFKASNLCANLKQVSKVKLILLSISPHDIMMILV